MESQLLNRSLGHLPQHAFQLWHTRNLIDSLMPAPGVRFDSSLSSVRDVALEKPSWAHRTGVNALTIDHFEGRL
jgi:hypothetical protein